MEYLHPYLYEIVHDIVQKRISDKKFPYVATGNDVKSKVLEDVTKSLDEMEAEGLLSRSNNINGIGLYRNIKSDDC